MTAMSTIATSTTANRAVQRMMLMTRSTAMRKVSTSSSSGAVATKWHSSRPLVASLSSLSSSSMPSSSSWTTLSTMQQQQQLSMRWFSTSSTSNNNNNGTNQAEEASSGAEKLSATEGEGADEDAARTQETAAGDEQAAAATIQGLERQVKDLRDQLLRSLAEQENTRRIAQRDVESAKQFAIKSFAKSLLEVADNLERALSAVPEEAKQANTVLNTLVQGIEMTDKELQKAFQMNGLVKYGAVGDAFDPNQHEALYEYVDPNKEPGTVGQVMKAGFLLHKRVLRPAEVGVVKKA